MAGNYRSPAVICSPGVMLAVIKNHTGVTRTLVNIYDGELCNNFYSLTVVVYLPVVDVCRDPEYASSSYLSIFLRLDLSP